jgi:hypothetical protein
MLVNFDVLWLNNDHMEDVIKNETMVTSWKGMNNMPCMDITIWSDLLLAQMVRVAMEWKREIE